MMSRATLWADAERETGTNWSPTPEVICGVANGNPVLSNGTSRKNMFGMQQCNLFSAPRNNMAQSTNDVFPTAMRLAALTLLNQLLPELVSLEKALQATSKAFENVIKSGRTHLQD